MFLHRDTQRFFEVLGVERATQRRFTFLETRNEGDWEKRKWVKEWKEIFLIENDINKSDKKEFPPWGGLGRCLDGLNLKIVSMFTMPSATSEASD